jgi:hypothetical protein
MWIAPFRVVESDHTILLKPRNDAVMLDNELGFVNRIPMPGAVLPELWIALNLFLIFYHLDNILVALWLSDMVADNDLLERWWKWTNGGATYLILFIAARLGKSFGMQPLRLKYTPIEDFACWIALKVR